MKLINLTPHPIIVRNHKGEYTNCILPEYGDDLQLCCRVHQVVMLDEPICGVPTSHMVVDKIERLPEKQEGVYYIISNEVMKVILADDDYRDRDDVLIPNKPRKYRSGYACEGLLRRPQTITKEVKHVK